MNQSMKSIASVAGLAVLFGGGFVFKDVKNAGPMGISNSAKNTFSNQDAAGLFSTEFSRIATEYNDPSLEVTQLMYAGMGGAMSSLGDPYTTFFEPVVSEEFMSTSEGKFTFGGIGSRLQSDPLGVKVTQVFLGSPAQKSGIKNGDIIIAVNGKQVAGQDSDRIVGQIKGQVGTTVVLKLLRSGNKTISVSIKRAQIMPPSADSNVLEGSNIGYLLVTEFQSPTAEQFLDSIQRLEKENIQGLVIDMRNNPGGLLESSRRMLSLFLDYKLVLTMNQQGAKSRTERTYGGVQRNFKYPITILINENSASAAEIFSGAMQDYKKATLVGEHSYGKASVQNVIPLTNGASAKITIAHYLLPSGRNISRKLDDYGGYVSGGIKPDVLVELNQGAGVAYSDPITDNQLRAAMAVIVKKNPKARYR